MRDGMIKEFTVAENMILREHHKEPYSRGGFLNLRNIASHSDQLDQQVPGQDSFTRDTRQESSGGNIQKVVLARSFPGHPRAIIAAQPTRGLDIGATEYVREQLLEQRREGTAILLISEDLDEILALSDRIAVIYEGQIMDILPREKQRRKAGPADGRRADRGKAVESNSIGSVVAAVRDPPAAAWGTAPRKVPPSFTEGRRHFSRGTCPTPLQKANLQRPPNQWNVILPLFLVRTPAISMPSFSE